MEHIISRSLFDSRIYSIYMTWDTIPTSFSNVWWAFEENCFKKWHWFMYPKHHLVTWVDLPLAGLWYSWCHGNWPWSFGGQGILWHGQNSPQVNQQQPIQMSVIFKRLICIGNSTYSLGKDRYFLMSQVPRPIHKHVYNHSTQTWPCMYGIFKKHCVLVGLLQLLSKSGKF